MFSENPAFENPYLSVEGKIQSVLGEKSSELAVETDLLIHGDTRDDIEF